MGHTKPENIKDLSKELDQIRKLTDIKEKGFGVFYMKSKPFLHFHDKAGRRWAHIKVVDGWKEIDIDFEPTKMQKSHFLAAVEKIHQQFVKASKNP